MVTTPLADPQAQRSDLGPIHVDTWGIRPSDGDDAEGGEQIDHRLLQEMDHALDPNPAAAQIEQDIGDELARAVIGHLTAAIHLDDRDIAGIEQMLKAPGLPQGEDRRVLQ